MSKITLKHLRYFEALARTGHFGRAAETAAISQPALSMQIKELEQTLGAALFDRGARAVRLTPQGEEFGQKAREILRLVDELEDSARLARDQIAGRLRLGVIPTVAPYLLPQVIAELARAYPALDLQLRETITPRLLQELGEGRLDCAIVALPVSEPALVEVPLFAEDFVLVRPLRDADKPVPGAETLREMRLLLLEEGHCFRDQALSFCKLRTTAPREMMDGSSLTTLVQMVGAGIGVTLIPEMAVPVETRLAPVAVAGFAAPRPSRQIGMVWRRSSPLGRQLAAIAEVVQSCGEAALLRARAK